MLVVDANIAVKFVTHEPGRNEAYDRVHGEDVLVAPDWIMIEVGHALWCKAKLGLVEREAAQECLDNLPSYFVDFVGAPSLATKAHKLAFELDHWIYDCLYLALALDRDALLLTADRKFWNAAKRAGFGGSVELLSWAKSSE